MTTLANPFDTVKRAISEAEREYQRAVDPSCEPTAGGWELGTFIRDDKPVTVKIWNRKHPYLKFARLLTGEFVHLRDHEWDEMVLSHE